MLRYGIIFILLYAALACQASGEKSFPKTWSGFIENKGQVIDQNINSNPAVLYMLNTPGFNVQLRKEGFSYDVYEITHPNKTDSSCPNPSPVDHDSLSLSFHRIDFDFLDHNKPDIVAEGKSADFTNYYTAGTSAEGILNVHGYSRIIYKNLYDKIDLVCEINEKTPFKYSFIVHRGGDLNAIKFRISGASSQVDVRGSILINNRFGKIAEEIPASYVLSIGRRSEVNIKFRSAGENLYQFSCEVSPDFDSLVVDPIPNREWGTYFGGGVNDYLADLCLDDQFLYFNGTTLSSAVIATAGAFQGTLAGTQDAFIQKFKTDGSRVWGTYFGGENIEWGSGLDLDNAGHLALTGWTSSLTGMATTGSYQPVYGGGSEDGFIALFDTSGQRIWSTYYGGSSLDNISRCKFDGLGNLYVAGSTQSSNNISTPGCHQFTYSGGWSDGFFAKFALDGSMIWGTYYGGNFKDYLSEIDIDQQGMIIIAGQTNSSNNIASTGAYQGTLGNPPAMNGPYDTFLCRFDPSGVRLWGTYYGGNGIDSDVGLGISADGVILLSGSTYSTDAMSSAGAYQPSISGPQDAFYAKFDLTGTRLYGTYFGGPMYEWSTNITTDEASNVYLSGSTSSDEGIATPDGFLTTNAATGFWPNAFLVRFNSSNQRVWGTYYGDSISTWSYRVIVRVDTIYMAGPTNDIKGIASPGAFQSSMMGSASGFVVRLNDCYAPDSLHQITGPLTICYPSSGIIYSVAPVANTTGYVWTVPSGATIAAGQNTNVITVDFGTVMSPGFITVYARNQCGRTNTVQLSVNPEPAPVPSISGSSVACTGETKTYITDPGKSLYSWTVSPGGTNAGGGTITDNFVDVTWNLPGNQWIRVNYTDINGCTANQPTNQNVTVTSGDSVKVSIAASSNDICAGTSVTFTATPTGSGTLSYDWKVNGISQPGNSTIFSYSPVNNDIVTCELTSSLTVCISNNPATSNGITMTVNPNLPVSVTVTPTINPVCVGTSVTFTANPTHGGSLPGYQWKVNGGSIVGATNSTYAYTPLNGDIITCELTSSDNCVTGNPALSPPVTMTVTPNPAVTVSITPNANPFCPGSQVTFIAVPNHGGLFPTYLWKVNGSNAGTNSSSFTYAPLNGDVVTCELTSSDNCVTGNPATSAPITMTASPVLAVSVAITASSNPFCAGSQVIFTATPNNGGLVPAYQWKVNGSNTGTNSPSFTYSPANGDQISCLLNSSASCITGNPALSNIITMTVNTNLPAGVSISTPTNPFCPGTSVTITAAPTNGGLTPVYQWKINGANAGTNLFTFTFNPVAGDSVRCVMTSNLNCVTGNPASSGKIIMSGNPVPSVSFTACFDTVTILGAQPFSLHGGLPLGGQYSGPGVNSITGTFTPSVAGTGLKTITYGYANVYTCLATKTKTILVLPNPSFTCGNNLTDIRDNKIYPTVQIGSQCWMSSNLDFGFQISDFTPQTDNCIAEKFVHTSSFVNQYSIFQWDELMRYQTTPGAQGLCPPGWHIPTAAEWNTLLAFYSGP